MTEDLTRSLVLVYPVRSLADIKDAARNLQSLIESRHAGVNAFLKAHGLETASIKYSHLLDLVSKLARLRDWTTAQQILPAEAESVGRLLRTREEASDGRLDAAQAAGLRFLPNPLSEEPKFNLSALEKQLIQVANEEGFQVSHGTKKKIELVNRDRSRVAYIDRNRTATGVIAIIVQPSTDLSRLFSVEGLRVPPQSLYYHSSNLRAYPKHEHRGQNQIPYGYSIVCSTTGSARRLFSLI